jgi:hypothetical protein
LANKKELEICVDHATWRVASLLTVIIQDYNGNEANSAMASGAQFLASWLFTVCLDNAVAIWNSSAIN